MVEYDTSHHITPHNHTIQHTHKRYTTAQRNTTQHILHNNTPHSNTYHSLAHCAPTRYTTCTHQHHVTYHIATYTHTDQHMHTTTTLPHHRTPQRHTTHGDVASYAVRATCVVCPVAACRRVLLCYGMLYCGDVLLCAMLF